MTITERVIHNETNLPKSVDEIIAVRRARRKPHKQSRSSNKYSTRWRESGVNRAARAFDVKQRLVNEHGGRCVICGYSKRLAALEFHHVVPKDGPVHINPIESEKCILLCSVCHREHHNGGIQY
jgi:5-methylcytosine-specific restriction endonuclease McrA